MRRAAAYLVSLSLMTIMAGVACGGEGAQKSDLTKEGVEFFERYIRPVLAERCYECHSVTARSPKGKLLLDSKPAMIKGGVSGAAIVPGDVEKSRLILAIRW